MKNTKYNQGFTLIELLVVVAIIGILSALAYPSYQDYILKGRLTMAHSMLKQIDQNIKADYLKNIAVDQTKLNNYPPMKDPQFSHFYSVTWDNTKATLTASPTQKNIYPATVTLDVNQGTVQFDCKGKHKRVCSSLNHLK